MNFPFKGSWLVNYDPGGHKYPEVLIDLARIHDFFADRNISFGKINVNFNENGPKNHFFKENGDIFLSFCGFDKEFAEKLTYPCVPSVLPPLQKPVETISLFFPRLDGDPRWKTINLPAGQLFLASSLRAGGFATAPFPLPLPDDNHPPAALTSDLAGFTVFEDLLPFLKPFLADLRSACGGILAAGGPFPTLAPLAALYHLPQINLFVRGEAELVLPEILQALNQVDAETFFSHEGVFWQQPGLIAMAAFDRINRPDDLNAVAIDLDLLASARSEHGLEINFSRGCGRGCLFCCRAQGTTFRKLSFEKVDELLEKHGKKTAGERNTLDRALNINDDDILQDPIYASGIFKLIRKHGFRIFGIQTATASLVENDGSLKTKTLELVGDPELYVNNRPLLWLGTDAFLPRRARRLGKRLPTVEKFRELLRELEERRLRHFHYWISSDGDSDWEEFVEELASIFGFFRDFRGFGLLAHAPFVIPYPASRLFKNLPAGAPGLKIKLALGAPDYRFSYKVVERLETAWPQLNRLLRNERAGGEKGFLDFLKERDLLAAAQLAYHFLKQERLQHSAWPLNLRNAQQILEKTIGELLESQMSKAPV